MAILDHELTPVEHVELTQFVAAVLDAAPMALIREQVRKRGMIQDGVFFDDELWEGIQGRELFVRGWLGLIPTTELQRVIDMRRAATGGAQ